MKIVHLMGPFIATSLAITLATSLFSGCQDNTNTPKEKPTSTQNISIIDNLSQRHLDRNALIIEKLLQIASDEINKSPQRALGHKERYTAQELEEFFSNSSIKRSISDDIYKAMDKKVEELALFLKELQNNDKIDYTQALSLEYVNEIEEGKLLVNNETLLDVKTLEGSIGIEILNTIARGEPIEPLLKNSSKERGFIMGVTQAWENNTVIYKDRFTASDSYGEYSSQMQKALREWESKTDIKFLNYDEQSRWTKYLVTLRLKRCSVFSNKDISATGGLAYTTFIGVIPLLPTDIVIGENINYPRAFAHEIGHLLGLMHEHQRGDRDEFITLSPDVDANNFNYIKVPLYLETPATEIAYYTKENCYLGICNRVTYPYLVSSTSKVNLARYSEFDYASIMLYPSFTTKKELYKITTTSEVTTDFNKTIGEKYTYKAIGEKVFENPNVSRLDFETINRFYPKNRALN